MRVQTSCYSTNLRPLNLVSSLAETLLIFLMVCKTKFGNSKLESNRAFDLFFLCRSGECDLIWGLNSSEKGIRCFPALTEFPSVPITAAPMEDIRPFDR